MEEIKELERQCGGDEKARKVEKNKRKGKGSGKKIRNEKEKEKKGKINKGIHRER